MGQTRDIWLITNEGSGSVREDVLAGLHETCESANLSIAGRTLFPRDALPTPEMLSRIEIDVVLALGGDGTLNAVVAAMAGWDGAILPLPGGTQNLLTKRLHGKALAREVVHAFAAGHAGRTRPTIIRSARGIALAGLLVGPGTSWNAVREALRAGDAGQMLTATGKAIEDTTGNAPVRIAEPEVGEPDGYPILELVPHEAGIDICAYHARTGADFAAQTWALLRQEFREGPHETYGPFDRLVLESTGGEPLDLLLDGEPAHGSERETFTLDTCPVDLIATHMKEA